MAKKEQHEDEIFICMNDLLAFYKKNKSLIILFTVIGAMLFSFFAMTRPILYMTSATFKCGGSSSQGFNSSSPSLQGLLSSYGNPQSDVRHITLMKSREVIGSVVKKLSLQATIEEKGSRPSRFSSMANQCLIEYKSWKTPGYPPLKDFNDQITCQNIRYDEELSTSLTLVFTSESEYDIFSNNKKYIGSGKIGIDSNIHDISFTIARTGQKKLTGKTYFLALYPFNQACQSLSKSITIKPFNNDLHVLEIIYQHRNRTKASTIVNCLMDIYHEHLLKMSQDHANTQLTYLKKREREATHDMKNLLSTYKDLCSENIQAFSLMSTEEQTKFFAEEYKEFTKDIFAIDLQLQSLDKKPKIFLESTEGSLSNLFEDIRKLHQHKDSLELSLSNRENPQDIKVLIASHYETLKAKQSELTAAIKALKHLEAGVPLKNLTASLEPHTLVQMWEDRDEQEDSEDFRNSLTAYLKDAVRIMSQQINTMKEHFSHLNATHTDFQGLDIYTAKELYGKYNEDIANVQSDIRQFKFSIEALHNPDFEIGAFCTALKDDLSPSLFADVAELSIKMKNSHYYTEKESERFKTILEEKKRFITLHTQQIVTLLDLKEQVLKGKMHILEEVILNLVNQNISSLEKQFHDFLQLKKEELLLNRTFLEKQIDIIKQKMSGLPTTWIEEQSMQFQMDLNKQMLKEVASLIESRIIAHNLENIDSSPLDEAIAPLSPERPNIVLLSILGAFFGAFASLAQLSIAGYKKGFPVSVDNLSHADLHFLGTFDRGSKSYEKKTLHSLARFLSKDKGKILTCTIEKHTNYIHTFASLLVRRGDSVLIVDVSYAMSNIAINPTGIFTFLSGESSHFDSTLQNGIPIIPTGVKHEHDYELLESRKFAIFLEEQKKAYDWIIIASTSSPTDNETFSNMIHSDYAIFTVTDETIDDFNEHQKLCNNLAFIIAR